MTLEQQVYCWDAFVVFAIQEGIGLEYEEDWGLWWKTWKAGIEAKYKQLI